MKRANGGSEGTEYLHKTGAPAPGDEDNQRGKTHSRVKPDSEDEKRAIGILSSLAALVKPPPTTPPRPKLHRKEREDSPILRTAPFARSPTRRSRMGLRAAPPPSARALAGAMSVAGGETRGKARIRSEGDGDRPSSPLSPNSAASTSIGRNRVRGKRRKTERIGSGGSRVFLCSLCSQSFKHAKDRNDHVNIEHQNKVLICAVPTCRHVFTRNGTRNVHLRRKHGINNGSRAEEFQIYQRPSSAVPKEVVPWLPEYEPEQVEKHDIPAIPYK